ncbi:MAG: acylphosphatase [Candidatus Nanohaloarchaea archaeon]
MERVHVYISGNVQGVTFRASTREKARRNGVQGWVKNLPDGRVEAVFEGEKDDIQDMLDFCREGPRPARVEDVDVEEETPEGLTGFEVRR